MTDDTAQQPASQPDSHDEYIPVLPHCHECKVIGNNHWPDCSRKNDPPVTLYRKRTDFVPDSHDGDELDKAIRYLKSRTADPITTEELHKLSGIADRLATQRAIDTVNLIWHCGYITEDERDAVIAELSATLTKEGE